MVANTTVIGNLNLLSNKIFNVGTYNLAIGSVGSISATALSSSCYIHTAGNSGDGGITKTYSSNTSFIFPVGCYSTNRPATYAYTPATIGFNSNPTTYGSITVIPVGYEHPATTADNQSLTFYWRVKSTGLTGYTNKIIHSFVYSPTDIQGAIASYIPSLYNRTNYTWNNGVHSNINTGTYTISDWTTPANSPDFIDADYTAGDNTTGVGSFGSATKFYSIAGTNITPAAWNSSLTWSHTDGGAAIGGAPVAGTTYPGQNSIVIIDNNHYVNLTATALCASLQIANGSVLDIQTFSGSNFGMVLNYSGNNGLFRLTTAAGSDWKHPQTFNFPGGDFSDFNVNHGTTEFYDIDGSAGALYILPSNVTSYGNLILTAKNSDNLVLPNNSSTTVNGNLTIQGNLNSAWIAMSWNTSVGGFLTNPYSPTVEKTIHVTGNLNILNGTLLYMCDFVPQHLIVDGNVTVAAGAAFDIEPHKTGTNIPNGNSQANTLAIGGSLINNTTSGGYGGSQVEFARLGDNGQNYYCDVTFFGNSNESITNTTSTPTTIFNKVINFLYVNLLK